MKYAIISDVHSNIESLERALALVEPDEELICLGDIVGYGPNPNECVERIRDRVKYAVLGNHDLAAVENFGVEHFNDAARAAISWTQSVLHHENKSWLNELSYELRLPQFLLVHGAPVEYFEYILDKRTAKRALERTDAPLVFIGHTHIAEWYGLDANGDVTHNHMQHGGTLELDLGKRYIIDVGSVGQPRDLHPEGCFVRFDTVTRQVEWVRYTYPVSNVQQKIHACHLPEYLATRLAMGR